MMCTICLSQNSRIYHSICEVCNNCVCGSCYADRDVHNLVRCPVCRTRLEKKSRVDCQVGLYFFSYFRHFFLHIIINIMYTNVVFYYHFPTENIDKLVPKNKTAFLLLLNFCNFIIVPVIFNSFHNYVYMNYVYCAINFLLCQIISNVRGKDLGSMYSIYCLLYIYALCFIHFTIINLSFFFSIFNHHKKLFIKNSNIYKLVSYRSFHNTRL